MIFMFIWHYYTVSTECFVVFRSDRVWVRWCLARHYRVSYD